MKPQRIILHPDLEIVLHSCRLCKTTRQRQRHPQWSEMIPVHVVISHAVCNVLTVLPIPTAFLQKQVSIFIYQKTKIKLDVFYLMSFLLFENIKLVKYISILMLNMCIMYTYFRLTELMKPNVCRIYMFLHVMQMRGFASGTLLANCYADTLH